MPNTEPQPSSTKVGPLSRNHPSSMATRRTSTAGPQRVRAATRSASLASMTTGSNREMTRATLAHATLVASMRPKYTPVFDGHAIQQRRWGCHSAGIWNPRLLGVFMGSDSALGDVMMEVNLANEYHDQRS